MRPLLFAALCLSLPASQAQPALPLSDTLLNTTSNTSSIAATAPTPGIKYCSAFEQYRIFKDEDVADWKKTNAAVMQAGGWRAYAREARQPEPTQATSGNTNSSACPPGIRTTERTTERTTIEGQP
jgi:hypothetical protein